MSELIKIKEEIIKREKSDPDVLVDDNTYAMLLILNSIKEELNILRRKR